MDPSGITDPIPFEIRRGTVEEFVVLSVSGEVDLATAPHLEQALAECGDEVILLDLRDVCFMDSTGLSVLIRASSSRGGGVRLLAESDGPVRRLFDVAGVARELRIYGSLEDALAAGRGDEPPTG
jgi:anti-anti-sigma factor